MNRLLLAILIGIFLGVIVGGFFPQVGSNIYFLGELFLQALLALVVPLIVTSMVVGITHLGDVRKLGGIATTTIIYYFVTTAIASIIGITLVLLIQPGHASTKEERVRLRGGVWLPEVTYSIDGNTLILTNSSLPSAYDRGYIVVLEDQNEIWGSLVPQKMDQANRLQVEEWLDKENKKVVPKNQGQGLRIDLASVSKIQQVDGTIMTAVKNLLHKLIPDNIFQAMANNEVLPLIVFFIIFGIVLTTLGQKAETVIRLFEGLNAAIMKIVHLVMIISPIGIGALIAGRLGDAGGFAGFWPELLRLGKYAFTVLLGLFIHATFVLPAILYFFGKKNVFSYFKGMIDALTSAFSTASSSATIPLSILCTTENNKVSDKAANFVIPLGATVNMDGTALYEAVAAIFIAQMYGIDLDALNLGVIFLTSTLAAVGAAGVPEAGLITLVLVMEAVHLPIEGISLILAIDWFLDRFRTSVNVWGDAVGAAVVDHRSCQ